MLRITNKYIKCKTHVYDLWNETLSFILIPTIPLLNLLIMCQPELAFEVPPLSTSRTLRWWTTRSLRWLCANITWRRSPSTSQGAASPPTRSWSLKDIRISGGIRWRERGSWTSSGSASGSMVICCYFKLWRKGTPEENDSSWK